MEVTFIWIMRFVDPLTAHTSLSLSCLLADWKAMGWRGCQRKHEREHEREHEQVRGQNSDVSASDCEAKSAYNTLLMEWTSQAVWSKCLMYSF